MSGSPSEGRPLGPVAEDASSGKSGKEVRRARRIATLLVLLVSFVCHPAANAETAIPLLSGFDEARIEAAYPPANDESAGELAKLVYRLGAIESATLEARVGESSAAQLGDVVQVDGKIEAIQTLTVPERLVEFLEMSRLYVVSVVSGDSTLRVVTASLPPDAGPNDRLRGAAVVIELREEVPSKPIAAAASRLRWNPVASPRAGWKMLSESGVDISLMADISARNRRPLLAEDGEAFYAMLAAASTLQERTDLPAPAPVQPVTLLVDAEKLAGEWLRMDLETVQVTRIAVTEPDRQVQLGGDHYYQIDAVGDLGNVIVKLDRPDGQDGPPARFESRYPVSVVTRTLPEFLRQQIRVQEGGDAVVSQTRMMIGVDAFFYRLWSYETDFMKQYGQGEQFGPLLVAATIRNREPTTKDPIGVGTIGSIAATVVILGILATFWWNRRLAAQDREVQQKRRTREAEHLQLP